VDKKLRLYDSQNFNFVIEFVDTFDVPLFLEPIFDIASRSIVYTTTRDVNEELPSLEDDTTIKIVKSIVNGVTKLAAVSSYFNIRPENQKDGVVCFKVFGATDRIIVWRPHKNPISYLTFTPTQTHIYTISTGSTILGWDITPCLLGKAPNRSFKFERGISKAIIDHIGFSIDEVYLFLF
jgi:WD40 repeat protein